ncbi:MULTISPECIES: globin [unclassified Sporosarcina]|uniref:globin domain-containing protein n=1 Tax=unclassified Sporosarcina TaxID=2647733 RepID=UPI000C16606F|nr:MULTISPECIES: globin [unclassified Sporosarcina]PIC97984.1 globin [Sporosarcina sp. P29]PID03885.1 globin [Sporosarcina sp. P30]PID07486.1 globin [Sporosarcina sp. P31]PID10708.1 globin [Sporosarcina sp. P32b]
MTRKPVIPFEEIGEKKLHELIETFYAKVAVHPDLIPIFPNDLTETIRKQKQFQTQYLGGPNLFTEEHGHPMMKARHNPFPITPTRAEAWLACMAEAMDDVGLEGPLREVYYKRLVLTANHMVNRNEEEDQ